MSVKWRECSSSSGTCSWIVWNVCVVGGLHQGLLGSWNFQPGSVALKSAVSKALNARMLSNCRRAPGRRIFYDRSSIRNLYAQGSSTTPSVVIKTIWQLCKMCTQCVRLYHLNGRLSKLNAVCESKSIHPNFGFQRLLSPGSSRPHNAVFITFKRMKCIPEQNG